MFKPYKTLMKLILLPLSNRIDAYFAASFYPKFKSHVFCLKRRKLIKNSVQMDYWTTQSPAIDVISRWKKRRTRNRPEWLSVHLIYLFIFFWQFSLVTHLICQEFGRILYRKKAQLCVRVMASWIFKDDGSTFSCCQQQQCGTRWGEKCRGG